jgi:SAM-dependent methyltransferase
MDLLERAGTLQTRHPWEEARFRFFGGLLRRSGVAQRSGRVLDVGSGDAWLARGLARSLSSGARVVCWDDGYSEAVLAEPDFKDTAQFTFVRQRPAQRFDLVLALDVLEHVLEDREFVRTLVDENLDPGGHALVSVPCWPWLFTSHDAHLRHHRRYSPDGARELLERAGLEVVASGGLFHALLVPRVLQKVRELWVTPATPPPDLSGWRAPALVTGMVHGALALDGLASRAASALHLNLPGLSWWALCRKS